MSNLRMIKSVGLMKSEIIDLLLRDELDRFDYEASNVESLIIGCFTNCREQGHTYIVHAKNGKSFTFCIYEHRNSDEIIINGKEGHVSLNGELPYKGDNKNEYIASFGPDDYYKAARKLSGLIIDFLRFNKKGDKR